MTDEQNSMNENAPSEDKEISTRKGNETIITREIGIDMGHRVTNHGSKCKNVHGHRYKIQVSVIGPLFSVGEQEGMVLDFGFLKEEMMQAIDYHFDHGMTLWRKDPLTLATLGMSDFTDLDAHIRMHGVAFFPKNEFWGKVCIMGEVPTAENLSKLWYDMLDERVRVRSHYQAKLLHVKVWETPNCSAIYIP